MQKSSRRTERDALTSLDLIWRQDATLSQGTYRYERKGASNLSLCRRIAVARHGATEEQQKTSDGLVRVLQPEKVQSQGHSESRWLIP